MSLQKTKGSCAASKRQYTAAGEVQVQARNQLWTPGGAKSLLRGA